MTDAPTPRETADHADHIGDATTMIDHAELARKFEALAVDASAARNLDGAESMMVPVQTIYDLIVSRNALLSEIAALRGERDHNWPAVERLDLETRLAEQAGRATQAERQRDELRKAFETAANLFKLCTEPTMFENASTLNVYAQMTEWLVRNRPLIANQGADQ